MNMLRVDAGIRPETTDTPAVADKERAGYTAGLRELADWLDAHPEVPLPYLGAHPAADRFNPTAAIHVHPLLIGGGDPRDVLAAVARAMGNATKTVSASGSRMHVWRDFAGISVTASADRADVCERVVVGVEEITVEEPDPDAVAALPKIPHTKTVERVEWICSPLLATDGAQ